MCINTQRIEATEKLEEALNLMLSGRSCVIRGRAGTGKSTLIKKFAEESLYPIIRTAPTGVASLNIDGQTISSLLRLGIYNYSDQEIKEKNEYNYIPPESILVIDESFGLNAQQMNQVDIALRSATGIDEIFGGLQIILAGDDCQLLSHEEGDHWQHESFFKELPSIELSYSFRHENDSLFLKYLNQLRSSIKSCTPLNLEIWWKSILPHLSEVNTTDRLIIAPFFDEAKKINSTKQKLLSCTKKTIVLEAESYGPNPQGMPYFRQEISLDTPVIHTLNRNGLINGSMGVVTHIESEEEVYVTFNGDSMSTRILMEDVFTAGDYSGAYYVPLLPAFSLTARKVQGLTLKDGVISKTFLSIKESNENMRRLYVAMSRFTTLDKIKVYSH